MRGRRDLAQSVIKTVLCTEYCALSSVSWDNKEAGAGGGAQSVLTDVRLHWKQDNDKNPSASSPLSLALSLPAPPGSPANNRNVYFISFYQILFLAQH